MTFGLSSTIDLLSWAIVLLLAVKVVATLLLLGRNTDPLFQGRRNALLWWATKVTPVFVVPCLIATAILQRHEGDVLAYGLMMLFVLVAVPLMVRRHRNAIRSKG